MPILCLDQLSTIVWIPVFCPEGRWFRWNFWPILPVYNIHPLLKKWIINVKLCPFHASDIISFSFTLQKRNVLGNSPFSSVLTVDFLNERQAEFFCLYFIIEGGPLCVFISVSINVYKCLWVSMLHRLLSCPSAYVCVCLCCWRFMLWKRHLHSSAMSVTYSENVAPVSGDAPSENSVEITPKGRCSTKSPLCFLSLLSFTHGTLTSRVWECLCLRHCDFHQNYYSVTTTFR